MAILERGNDAQATWGPGRRAWTDFLEHMLLTTYDVDICQKSGDPGCLGTLSWHDGPCRWKTETMRQCLCGADELHRIPHQPGCPLHEDALNSPLSDEAPSDEALQALGAACYESLPQRAIEVCRRRGWSAHWTERGAYLHLEASELIEAVRGKQGQPAEEAADVLFVLMSITEAEGVPWEEVIERLVHKMNRLMTAPPYEGEEYQDEKRQDEKRQSGSPQGMRLGK